LFLALAVVLGAAAWWWRHGGPSGPSGREITAPSSARTEVRVGPNVQVSTAHASTHHFETLIGADPTDGRRLFAVAILAPPAGQGVEGVVGYFSEDGGKTWAATFGGPGDPKNRTGDPDLAFGPDGSLYLVRLRDDPTVTKNQGKGVDYG